jgi:hypothetical protein
MERKHKTVLKYQKSVCCNYNANFKLTEIKLGNLTLWRTGHDTIEIKKPVIKSNKLN